MSDELILNIGRQSLLLRYHDCGPDSEFIINGKEIVCSTCGEVLGPISLVMYPRLRISTPRESIIHTLGKVCLAYRLSCGYYYFIIDPMIYFRVHIGGRALMLQGKPVARPDALIPIPWYPIFIEYERSTWRNHEKTAVYRTVLYRIVAKNFESLRYGRPFYQGSIEPILVLAVSRRAKKLAGIYKRLGWNIVFLDEGIIQDVERVINRIEVPFLTLVAESRGTQVCISEPAPGQASQEHAPNGAGVQVHVQDQRDQSGQKRMCMR